MCVRNIKVANLWVFQIQDGERARARKPLIEVGRTYIGARNTRSNTNS